MRERLVVIHVEDQVFDVELAKEVLEDGGFECQFIHVVNEVGLRAALRRPDVRIVIADQDLPTFSGGESLQIVREQRPDVPFIFLSGTLRDQDAIGSLRQGASDYVFKHQINERLVPAVLNALREGEERSIRRTTERKLRLSTEALREARRLEALGRLAGGVAHDFNNMLSVILGQADLLMQEVEADDPRSRRLGTIREAARRSADLTRNLLAFSRRQLLRPSAVDLDGLVRDTIALLSQVLGSGVQVVFQPGEVGAVLVDNTLMHQALVNLAVNARDAMSGQGSLTFASEVVNFGVGENEPAPFAQLSVTDTGSGIPGAVLERVFDPFFTTKAEGKGTGLGLASVHGFVSQSGGHIEVESEVGRGTTFRLLLPIASNMEITPPTPPAPAVNADKTQRFAVRTVTALIVEDEPMLRELASESLMSAGHVVLQAGDGFEALEVVKAQPSGSLDLLITDVTLPGQSGVALATQLRKEFPGLAVLFMSGFTPEAHSIGERRWLEQESFLPKPFTPQQLCEAVRALADRQG